MTGFGASRPFPCVPAKVASPKRSRTLGVGGGITVRSTVEEEYAEAELKAVRLLAARPRSAAELRARLRRDRIPEIHVQVILDDLTAAGYVVKRKHGRRNSYQILAHLPLPEPASQEPAIGDVRAVLVGNGALQS